MLNQATILGNVGKDPETRYTPAGLAVTSISVATTEKWKDKATGEQKEQVEWHRVVAFGKLAEIIGEYVKKGTQVLIQGKITYRKYTDKDGIERTSTEIHADTMQMLGGRPQSDAKPAAKPPAKKVPAMAGGDPNDDIPF